jgi:AcrR family transcriptional regulator
MLLTVGALGYEATTAQEVADRAGIGRDQFQRRFGSKEECFGQAYEEAAERLREELLEGAARARTGGSASARPWPSCCAPSPSSHCWRRRC